MSETFGAYLRTIRQEKNHTQRSLAALAGCDFTYIAQIELGRNHPSSDLLRRVARALNVDESTLLIQAGRLPDNIKERMTDSPLLAELIHVLCERDLPTTTYQLMLVVARTHGENSERDA